MRGLIDTIHVSCTTEDKGGDHINITHVHQPRTDVARRTRASHTHTRLQMRQRHMLLTMANKLTFRLKHLQWNSAGKKSRRTCSYEERKMLRMRKNMTHDLPFRQIFRRLKLSTVRLEAENMLMFICMRMSTSALIRPEHGRVTLNSATTANSEIFKAGWGERGEWSHTRFVHLLSPHPKSLTATALSGLPPLSLFAWSRMSCEHARTSPWHRSRGARVYWKQLLKVIKRWRRPGSRPPHGWGPGKAIRRATQTRFSLPFTLLCPFDDSNSRVRFHGHFQFSVLRSPYSTLLRSVFKKRVHY